MNHRCLANFKSSFSYLMILIPHFRWIQKINLQLLRIFFLFQEFLIFEFSHDLLFLIWVLRFFYWVPSPVYWELQSSRFTDQAQIATGYFFLWAKLFQCCVSSLCLRYSVFTLVIISVKAGTSPCSVMHPLVQVSSLHPFLW